MPVTTAELARLVGAVRNVRGLLEQRVNESPDRPYVRFEGRDISYLEFDKLCNAVANSLLARGLGPGSRIALMMTNSPSMLAFWLGAAKVGVVTVMVNPASKGDGLAYLLNDSRPALLVADAEFVPQLDALRADEYAAAVPRTVLVGGNNELFAGSAARPPLVDVGPESPCTILYTSGTTGPPKGCLLPHGQYLCSAFLLSSNCRFDRDTVMYCCMPLFHIAAQNYSALTMLAAGGTWAVDARFSASRFWQRIVETGATAFNFVGAMAMLLWKQPPSELDRGHGATVGFGAPLSAEIWAQWEARFGVRILQAFGMTENALPTLIAYDDAPVPEGRRGSAGRRTASSEIRIVDDAGVPVEPGVVGELETRQLIPWTMMSEYVGRPDAMREAFHDTWFRTGDLGYLSADGDLFWVDRKKDALRRRGEMVSSWELETLIGRYPGVLECAIVGVPSDITEDEILAVVVCDERGIDPAALIAYCAERTARFQVPRYVRIVDELPRTPTQRIEKYRLRAEGVTPGTWDALTSEKS